MRSFIYLTLAGLLPSHYSTTPALHCSTTLKPVFSCGQARRLAEPDLRQLPSCASGSACAARRCHPCPWEDARRGARAVTRERARPSASPESAPTHGMRRSQSHLPLTAAMRSEGGSHLRRMEVFRLEGLSSALVRRSHNWGRGLRLGCTLRRVGEWLRGRPRNTPSALWHLHCIPLEADVCPKGGGGHV